MLCCCKLHRKNGGGIKHRPDFADEAWASSQEHLRVVVVELARCVLPFSEHPYLPLQHAAALLLVGRLSERAKGARSEEEGVPGGLYSSLKYSTKKNGVARAAADVRERGGGGGCRSRHGRSR